MTEAATPPKSETPAKAPPVSISPGRFRAGLERDEALKARAAFHDWLRESITTEATQYRLAVHHLREARSNVSLRRRKAREAFKQMWVSVADKYQNCSRRDAHRAGALPCAECGWYA